MARKTTAQIHDQVRDMMVTALEAGTVPWHKPWTTKAGTSNRPVSLSTRKPYRGTNVWTLGLTALEHGYSSPWWGTYNQIAQLSGMVRVPNAKGFMTWASPDGTPRGVRAGEKSTLVLFVKKTRVRDRDSDDPKATKLIYMTRTSSVFNACQADSLPERLYGLEPATEDDAKIFELAEPEAVVDAYLANGGPTLRHVRQNRAFYSWADDTITLPERDQFDSVERYYSTKFHEVGHSTGCPKRLDRDEMRTWTGFGSHPYGREELTAEMTAAMLCALTGVEGVFDNSASYIASWLKAIKGDSDLVIRAASDAQAAVDLILAEHDDSEDDNDESENA